MRKWSRKLDGMSFVQQPSVGVDSLDLEALRRAGVPVANTAGINSVAVAEWCVAAAYGSMRRLAWVDAKMRMGGWPRADIIQQGCAELTGRRVGIVGMGSIGVECAKRFVALGADVVHWSRRERSATEAGGARWTQLDDLLSSSQVLVIVIALSDETRALLDARRLQLMPAGAFVINAGRGEIVDEMALLEAITSGHLGGAALDVYAAEPLPADSPLRADDRILLSPHVAGATAEAQQRLIRAVIDNVGRAVNGEPVRNVLNGLEPRIERR